jgi:small-conductance mechanosensitive channel/CRP-like cAMP-binding protein
MLNSIGVALLVASAAAALLCLLAWRGRGRNRGIFLGLSLLVLFLVLRLMIERLLPALVEAPPMLRSLIGQGLATLAALAAAFAIDAAIRRFLWYGTLREGEQSRVPNILIGLASLGGYALTGLLVASEIFGLDVTALAATSGVVAIVLGVSAQQTLGQVFAGLALNMSRPFRLGDSVQIDGVWGVVVDANWRAVTLRTYEGTLVAMPNMLVASTRLTNFDQPHHDLRQHIPFVVDADVPPGQVRSVALAAMAGLPQVLADPAPLLLLKSFEDRGVAYEAIFWHRDPNLTILRRDEVAQALWYALRRAGMPISVHRRLLAMPQGATLPFATDSAAEPARLLALLRQAPLTAGFPEAELQAVAARARHRLFAAGERIIRHHELGDSMFAVLSGRVSVRLEDARGVETEIYTQGAGEIFGHMSALTGAPRFATVRAASHLLLAELDKASLAPMIAAHPELVDFVAREILRIDAAHAALLQARAPEMASAGQGQAGLLDRLSDRIRSFFGDRDGPPG